jgi:hypothetical protein
VRFSGKEIAIDYIVNLSGHARFPRFLRALQARKSRADEDLMAMMVN